MTRDEKNVLHNKTINRLLKLGVDVTNSVEVVVALTNEIDCYRTKINAMQDALDDKCDKIKRMEAYIDGANARETSTQLEAVQQSTTAEIIKALSDNGYNTITINCYKDTESEEN